MPLLDKNKLGNDQQYISSALFLTELIKPYLSLLFSLMTGLFISVLFPRNCYDCKNKCHSSLVCGEALVILQMAPARATPFQRSYVTAELPPLHRFVLFQSSEVRRTRLMKINGIKGGELISFFICDFFLHFIGLCSSKCLDLFS